MIEAEVAAPFESVIEVAVVALPKSRSNYANDCLSLFNLTIESKGLLTLVS